MKFSLSRESLLNPLQLVAGVVERRQTLPILSNILFSLNGNSLSLTGTDLEVEIKGTTEVTSSSESGEATVSARKMLDICRALPEGADLNFTVDDGKAFVTSGKSRFSLATLPANEFPSVDEGVHDVEFTAPASMIKGLIEATSFAMAQQDVRYYLNGMLWEVTTNQLRAVATDGHRLALCDGDCDGSVDDETCFLLMKHVHDLEINTHILDDGWVASGGSDLFFSGIHRTKGANTKIGVHAWSEGNNEATDYPVGHANHLPYIAAYVSIGFSQEKAEELYYFIINAASADDIHWMTDAEIEAYSILSE